MWRVLSGLIIIVLFPVNANAQFETREFIPCYIPTGDMVELKRVPGLPGNVYSAKLGSMNCNADNGAGSIWSFDRLTVDLQWRNDDDTTIMVVRGRANHPLSARFEGDAFLRFALYDAQGQYLGETEGSITMGCNRSVYSFDFSLTPKNVQRIAQSAKFVRSRDFRGGGLVC